MSASRRRRVPVATTDQVPEGARLVVEVAGRSIGIFNVGGRYYALRNRCPHQGGPLCEGEIVSRLESDGPGEYRFDPGSALLACPWHGWEFDLATGQSWFDPARTRSRAYPVTVRSGGELELGPYTAETVPVSAERDYLVLELSD